MSEVPSLPADVHQKVRDVCLGFPEASEKLTWGHPTFRVRDRIFASLGMAEDSDVPVMTMKAAPGEQESLLAEGHPFFFPKYVGSKGWIGIVIEGDTDWSEIAELVGYQSEPAFRKAFRKAIGETPGSVRRKARANS